DRGVPAEGCQRPADGGVQVRAREVGRAPAWLAPLISACAVLAAAWPARADRCVRTGCSAAERDEHGCCPAAPKKRPERPARPPAQPAHPPPAGPFRGRPPPPRRPPAPLHPPPP